MVKKGVVYSDGEIAGVALTPSEQGSLNLYELAASELAEAGMEENPGYMADPAEKLFPDATISPESVYNALYIEGEDSSEGVAIETLVYNSEDMSLVLGNLTPDELLNYDRNLALLYKGNTLVIVQSSLDSYPASDLADKLSRRLGMEILGI